MAKSLLDYAYDYVSGQSQQSKFEDIWAYCVKEAGLSKEEADKKEAEDMFQKFKGYIELIDVVSDNTGSKDNHDDSEDTKEDAQILLPSEEINEIIVLSHFQNSKNSALNIYFPSEYVLDEK